VKAMTRTMSLAFFNQ